MFDIKSELKRRNSVEPTLAARFHQYMNDECGEMWQVLDADGKVMYASRDVWNGVCMGWHWICDPTGYQERDCRIDEKYNIILCGQDWTPFWHGEGSNRPHYQTWEQTVQSEKLHALAVGIIKPEHDKPKDLLRKFWEKNPRENYFENCLWCRWTNDGKPVVVSRFMWAGMKCYVVQQTMTHQYYKVRKKETWVMCGAKYYGLPKTFLCQEAWVDDNIAWTKEWKSFEETHSDVPDILRRKTPADDFYREDEKIVLTDCMYIKLSAPSVKVYKEFCKRMGLRPGIADTSGRSFTRRAGFKVETLSHTVTERPDGFAPYPVMSNGRVYEGGIKVEANRLLVWRPNPNCHAAIMEWQQYREWCKENVHF